MSVTREEFETVKKDLSELSAEFKITINQLITKMDSMNNALTSISDCMKEMKNNNPDSKSLELILIKNKEKCHEDMSNIAKEVIENEMGKFSLKMIVKVAGVVLVGSILAYLGIK